ncbi:MAG: hypothetical protein RBT63_01150 [Bdellovibrionales bacterium]|jgi:hypothetical protein|nr:hypothetical protein [Bdellovibrionales bacterium]
MSNSAKQSASNKRPSNRRFSLGNLQGLNRLQAIEKLPSFEKLQSETAELARNTVSAAEFLADSVRAESRYFTRMAMEHLAHRLNTLAERTGAPSSMKTSRRSDAALEPLAGVPVQQES